MANLTNYANSKIVDHVHGKTAFTMPTNLYLALGTGTPTPASTSLPGEPTIGTGGYARVQTTAASWNAAASGVAANAATLSFPASTGAWSTGATNLAYVGYYDAATGGNLILFAPLGTPQAVNAAGITIQFNAGDLSDTLA